MSAALEDYRAVQGRHRGFIHDWRPQGENGGAGRPGH